MSATAPEASAKAKLRETTSVLLVGNIEDTMRWYARLGFTAEYYPPGFCILYRDAIQIFIQHQPGYVRPDDPGARKREAWSIYIETDNLDALFKEFSALGDLNIPRTPCRQEYGMIEFDVMDLNGYRLVFAQPMR